MQTSIITGTVLSIALLGSVAAQAANFNPEEPYANFAVDQKVISSEQASHSNTAHFSNDGLFWGEGVGSNK